MPERRSYLNCQLRIYSYVLRISSESRYIFHYSPFSPRRGALKYRIFSVVFFFSLGKFDGANRSVIDQVENTDRSQNMTLHSMTRIASKTEYLSVYCKHVDSAVCLFVNRVC